MQTNIKQSDPDFLSELNVLLSANLESDKNIQLALAKLGEHEKADRIHIIDIKHDMTFSISHEWLRDGITSIQSNTPKTVFLFNKELEEQLNNENYIYIKDINAIKDPSLKNIMEATQVRCAIFFPLYISSHLLSFLSLSRINCADEWDETDISFLMKVASVFSGTLEKELILSKLVKHHSLYQDFIENKVDFILRLDRKLHVSYSNKRFYSLFGATPEEVIGCKFTTLVPELISNIQDIEEQADNRETILTLEAPLQRQEQILWIKWYIYSVKLEKEVIELHVVGHDITECHEEGEKIDLFKEELRAFSQDMYPVWSSIKEGLLNSKLTYRDDTLADIQEKILTFNRRYEELLVKIDPKFFNHAHRS